MSTQPRTVAVSPGNEVIVMWLSAEPSLASSMCELVEP